MPDTGVRPGDRLAGMDFEAHNAEVRAVFEALYVGKPIRTPVILGINTRYWMLSTDNPPPVDFETYFNDADAMFDTQLWCHRWTRFNLLHDAELGLPDCWRIAPDFQNVYEAGWFGCPINFPENQVPSSSPAFADCPERIMENGIPDPFGNLLEKGYEFQERYIEREKAGEEYCGRPVKAITSGFGLGTDGPMTVACNVFGADFVCTNLAADPNRMHKLLDFITEATILRITSWRKRYGAPIISDGWMAADDSIALISTRMYREHILPYHRRIYDAFSTQKGRGIHLCGDASRHFKTIRDELNVVVFDTGFPMDFGRVREELGPDILIQGGPHVDLLIEGTPDEVTAETKRILESGVLEGGRFILREGNNLAPNTPVENTEAMYHAGRKYGYHA